MILTTLDLYCDATGRLFAIRRNLEGKITRAVTISHAVLKPSDLERLNAEVEFDEVTMFDEEAGNVATD